MRVMELCLVEDVLCVVGLRLEKDSDDAPGLVILL